MNTTELIDGLRDVGNLHEFAELFGFDWYDESDWTWHDVAVRMADEITATLGGGGKSRWHALFGTPEKAARTLTVTAYACDSSIYCSESDCIFKDAPSCPPNCGPDDYDALLEWMRGDAE